MLRGIEIVASVVLCTALGAAGVYAATLTVTDVDDRAKPLSNQAELWCGKVTVGACGGKTLELVNRGDRSIAIELRISGRGFEPGETGSFTWGYTGTEEPFSVEECGALLRPGVGCRWSVDFCPETPGAKIGSLRILGDDEFVYRFRLKGTGVIDHTGK